MRYLFPVDQVIQALKYGRRLDLANFFADALQQRGLPISRTDGLVPTPLHVSRLRQRGFNQSHEIARQLAKRTGIALMDDVLARVKDTESQTGLSYRQRRDNVAGAFACSRDVRGLRLALIDDVMTTGATMRECALVLKNKGAVHVACWVAARVGTAD